MQITCANCRGVFDTSESKCPYCGMIYEPGAEKEYGRKMEKIRTNLDGVGDIVVSNFRKDIKRFLTVFLITLFCMIVFTTIALLARSNRIALEKEKAREEMDDKIYQIRLFKQASMECNNLFNEGKYDEMYKMAKEESMRFRDDFRNWKHFHFYNSYGNYTLAMESMNSIKQYNILGSYDYSHALKYIFELYVDLYVNEYMELSTDERKILAGLYEELREEALGALQLSEEEFDSIRDRLTEKKATFIDSSECDKIAKERLGE